MFFAKSKERSKVEVINDTNEMLITFYRTCQENFEELQEMIRSTLHSEAQFNRARDIYRGRKEGTAVEKAWALWVLANEGHAGSLYGGWKYCNGHHGTPFGRVFWKKREEFNEALYNRLCEVQISCRDALKVISNRDTPETFFYLDPPYVGRCQGHYYGYIDKDLENLLQILSGIKGRFILSGYWNSILNEAVERNKWFFKEVAVTVHPSANTQARPDTEVLIYNYPLEPTLF